MSSLTQTHQLKSSEIPLAIVLEGVSDKWQRNVLQVMGSAASVQVELDGYGTIAARAILLSLDQARHLASPITELLGPEPAPHF